MSSQPTVIPNEMDYINSTAIFAEIKKTILTKEFQGGSITNVFGSTKLDFTHADLNGMAILDISQGCGKVTLIVPTDWQIDADFSQILAVVDDHRDNLYQTKDSGKVLMLKGVSVCGVVELLNS